MDKDGKLPLILVKFHQMAVLAATPPLDEVYRTGPLHPVMGDAMRCCMVPYLGANCVYTW